ncbi:DUF481 domain-containing protein [Sorangium sp. So ce1182]|uniref:DUF481 domain-containing protein n=1 Tax=Sorangium sp. So ce1182 TaxID=3133334 RepID=UPI003F63843F
MIRPYGLACTLLALSLALLASPASAQIVNVHPLIAANGGKDGFAIAVEGSADVRTGNTRLIALSGSAIAGYRAGRHQAFLMTRAEFSEENGEPIVNKDLEHLRYRLAIKGPLEGEVFVQHDRDDFRRLALRALVGAGPRLRVAPFEGFEAAVSVALLLEHEQLAAGPEPDAGQRVTDARLSAYLVLSSSVTPHLKLGNTFYLQPRLGRAGDVRVLSETSLLAAATKHLSLKVSFSSAYDAAPPAGVLPLDATLKSTLQVSF